jgi:hypothetical protein
VTGTLRFACDTSVAFQRSTPPTPITAHADERILLTRDERAEPTYLRLKISYELVTGPA